MKILYIPVTKKIKEKNFKNYFVCFLYDYSYDFRTHSSFFAYMIHVYFTCDFFFPSTVTGGHDSETTFWAQDTSRNLNKEGKNPMKQSLLGKYGKTMKKKIRIMMMLIVMLILVILESNLTAMFGDFDSQISESDRQVSNSDSHVRQF